MIKKYRVRVRSTVFLHDRVWFHQQYRFGVVYGFGWKIYILYIDRYIFDYFRLEMKQSYILDGSTSDDRKSLGRIYFAECSIG